MKFSYKNALTFLIAICFVCVTSACGQDAESDKVATVDKTDKVYKWKLAHHRSPEANIHQDMLEFSENIKNRTDGNLVITIMAGGSLGNWTVAQERVAMGNFEMTISPLATAVDKRLECAMLPAAVQNWEAASRTYAVGAPFYELLVKWVREQNLQLLAPYPYYLGGIGFNREIENPGDPTLNRGLKVRIPEMLSFKLLIDGLGYIPTPIAITDIFPAMQTGVVDGVAGGGAETYWGSGLGDIFKSYLPLNSHFEVWFLMVNPDKFATLPKEYQEVVIDESIKLQNKLLKAGPAITAKWEQVYRDNGVIVYDLTPEQIAAYQKIMRDSSWDGIRKVVGAEAFDEAANLLK